MANQRITALSAMAGKPDPNSVMCGVDTTDTTMSASGTTKKFTCGVGSGGLGITLGSTDIELGSNDGNDSIISSLAGLTSVTSTSFTGALVGNASTATALETARTIAGVSFDGSGNIDIPITGLSDVYGSMSPTDGQVLTYDTTNGWQAEAAGTGTIEGVTAGANLSGGGTSGTVTLSLDTTITGLTSVTSTAFTGGLTGNATTATALETARTIGGTSFDGTGNIVPATITVADTTDTSCSVALFESATGDLEPKSDGGITYNAGTGTLSATAFSGPLAGNVTGNVTGDLTGAVTATGTLADGVTATTQSASDNSTKVATTAYVDAQVGSSDTLAEVLANGGTATSSALAGVMSDETGSGSLVFATSPTLVTPVLGTPTSGTLTNCTFPTLNQDTTGNAATVTNGVYTTNNLSVLAATTSAQLAGVISDETGSGALVFATSPTLVTPALGTPASGVLTNCTGTASGLTAGTVTTNANLTGDVTSSGSNATTIADNAVTLAKMAGLARGKIIYGDASGDPAALAAGTTDGHVLTIQNTNGDMAWEAPASGGGTVTGVTGTSPINSDGSSTTPTISIDDATTSAKGAASFSSDNFAVSSGAVTIKTGGVDLTDEVTGSLPDGNIASAATWNAKAASGANGDITELTGLTTALTVAQGGTGATSLTDKAVLISQDTGTDAIGAVALTSNGQIIVGGADGPAAATITAGTNVSVTNAANSITIASTDEFTGTVTSVSGGTGLTGTVTGSGSIALDLDSLTDVTGVHNNGWGAGDTVAIVDADSDGSRQVKMPAEIGIACSDETTLLTAGVKAKITVPRAMTVTEVKLSLNVADDTGLAISLEDREADPESTGTSMLDEDLNSGTDYTATATSFDSAASSYSLDEDDFVSVEITDIGGGEAKGLKVWLLGYWT